MSSIPILRSLSSIGPYQILEDLGVVPFGTAYAAVDARSDRSGREVVLKVIPPSLAGSSLARVPWEVLLAETLALARVYHPGLPRLLEVAEHDGCLLVAFEAIEGTSLARLLAGGNRPDRAQLIEWGIDLLAILAEAHGAGVLHRHLGEDEVVLHSDGHLVLTGFGLTRMVFESRATLAPEQLGGGGATVASDLYALGCLLQRLAFASRLKSAGPRGARERDPLLRVVARATSPGPEARFRSAAEMQEALRQARRASRALERAERRADRSRAAEAPATHPACPACLTRPTRPTIVPLLPAAPPPRIAGPPGNAERLRALLLVGAIVLLLLTLVVSGWVLIGQGFDPAVSPALTSGPAVASPSP